MRQAHIARGATSVLDAMNPILASTSNGIYLPTSQVLPRLTVVIISTVNY